MYNFFLTFESIGRGDGSKCIFEYRESILENEHLHTIFFINFKSLCQHVTVLELQENEPLCLCSGWMRIERGDV